MHIQKPLWFLCRYYFLTHILMKFSWLYFGEKYELCIPFALLASLEPSWISFVSSSLVCPVGLRHLALFSFQRPQGSLRLLRGPSSSLWDGHGKGTQSVHLSAASSCKSFPRDQAPLLLHQKNDHRESWMHFKTQLISQPEAASESLYSRVSQGLPQYCHKLNRSRLWSLTGPSLTVTIWVSIPGSLF